MSFEIIYDTEVAIDMDGLKYTMDGSADGHDINSSIDEIIHNIIDFNADKVSIHYIEENLWSFQFDIYKEINSVEKLKNGVSLYGTKGNVGINDISKYGKGIKSSAHCLAPNGYMILGIIMDGILKMAVYDQNNMKLILPDTENSYKIEQIFTEITNYDLSTNCGFLIIAINGTKNYDEIFEIFNEKCNEEYDFEEEESHTDLQKTIKNHISICYHPYLNTNFECDEDYIYILDMNVSFNNDKIYGFSHTKYSAEDIEDNAEIDYAEEYTCHVPYRLINDVQKYDYTGMYFKNKEEKFTFNKDGEKICVPEYDNEGLNENNVVKCILRITKLSTIAHKAYMDTYKYGKNKSCSYFVYRNGVCSETSHIAFEGDGGFQSYHCPQLRAELYCNNSFDGVIKPGSNKSLIRPSDEFKRLLRNLSKHIWKKIKKNNEKSKTVKKFIEGREYLILPNKKIMNISGDTVLGELKAGIPRWNKLKSYKAADKKALLNENNNTTPILSDTIEDHKDIKEKKGAVARLFTSDPSSGESGVYIISDREYKMIECGIINSNVLDDEDKLQETQIELHSIELNSIVQRINKKFRIVNNENQEINLSEIKLIPF